MKVLGIECTAHTFGIGFIDSSSKQILFSDKIQFKEDEGMDLRKLSEFHTNNFDSVLKKFKIYLTHNKLTFKDIDLIAFSQGPGIGNSLKVAALVAKTLALKYEIKIVGVNHIKAHLEIGKFLTGLNDPVFLYISGVNTQIIALDENNHYKIYGETEDIGLGNLIDSFGRMIGFGFPSGPIVEAYAKKGKTFIELNYSVKGMNVNIAGLFSTLKQKIEEFEQEGKVKIKNNQYKVYDNRDDFIADLCFSLQEVSFAMVLEIVERAIAYTKKKEFLIVGGVASNTRLSEMANQLCQNRKIKYSNFPIQYAVDNGAMIAVAGFIKNKEASKSIKDLKPMPYINIESSI